MVKYTGTVNTLQSTRENFWKRVFNEMVEFSGNEGMRNYGIKFTDKVVELSEKLKDSDGSSTNDIEEEGGDNI